MEQLLERDALDEYVRREKGIMIYIKLQQPNVQGTFKEQGEELIRRWKGLSKQEKRLYARKEGFNK